MESRIIQWLTSIQTHAPGSPILVVANQFEGDTPADLDHQQLQNDFPAIVGFFQLNAATKVGVPELIEAVRAAAGDLPLMGKPWPRSWHKAANAVRQHDEPYMSARTFENYLEKQGLDHRDSRAALMRSMHLLGDILFFQNDAELEDQVFLKPKWVSDLIVLFIEGKVGTHVTGAEHDCGVQRCQLPTRSQVASSTRDSLPRKP